MTDALGDRMKGYEANASQYLLPLVPIVARIDGRSFSRFTRGMERPYDKVMSDLMIATTKYLVEKTSALIGYTQSDEISLVFYADQPKSEVFFNGKIQKMSSVLAGMATASFMHHLANSEYHQLIDALPHFDARVFNVPNKQEAANALLWRELDATKNAISMAARAFFSHKELHKKNGDEMQEMLFQRHGVNFNDYPAFFKRGTFVRRVTAQRYLTGSEYHAIPIKHRPDPGIPVIRSEVKTIDMPRFSTVTNRVGVIFDKQEPMTAE